MGEPHAKSTASVRVHPGAGDEPAGVDREERKQQARDADLASIARGDRSVAEMNSDNGLGARVAHYFRPTFKFGVPRGRSER